MTVATQAPVVPQRAPSLPDGQRIVLYDIDWESYEKFLEAVENRRIFLTYDQGVLEIMAPLFDHESWKRRVGLLLPVLCSELGLEILGIGSTTLRRQDLAKGLEADEAFYIKHAQYMADPPRKRLDLSSDPPPDLALEVEGTRSSLGRLSIYAAFGIPEVWRFDGETIRVHRLQPDGQYAQCSQSPSFPALPVSDFVRFMQETANLGEIAQSTAFHHWVRQHVLPRVPSAGEDSKRLIGLG
jgi:Uma2 family endonuclease